MTVLSRGTARQGVEPVGARPLGDANLDVGKRAIVHQPLGEHISGGLAAPISGR